MATIIEMNTHGVQSNEFSQTLTKEQRLYAREQMARQFAEPAGALANGEALLAGERDRPD